MNAGRVRGGYQYDGKVYDWRFRHLPGRDTCLGCHGPHTLEVRLDTCKGCHTGVTTKEDLKSIRTLPSRGTGYDGDGDLNEGMYHEMVGLQELLLTGIQAYASQINKKAICYGSGYPYFFIDTDGDGSCSDTEGVRDNAYDTWTPRLVKAAYNYQVSKKDPGAFAHNAKYVIQLLYDAIEDLNIALATDIDISSAQRNDPGHFNGAGGAARHWDEDAEVSSRCSRCHGGSEGFRFFVEYGVGKDVPEQDNGLDCVTCHEDLSDPTKLLAVTQVPFPGGVTRDISANDTDTSSNLCATCHAGRVAAADIDAAISDAGGGAITRFLNVHYKPSGALKQGDAVHLAYQYPGKAYAGPFVGHTGGDRCVDCHQPLKSNHSFEVADAFPASCGMTCHASAGSYEQIRVIHGQDYDGDGDDSEPLRDEIADIAADLLAQMQTYATAGPGAICYNGDRYPYFFKGGEADGVCTASDTSRYDEFDAALLKAAHNYQISQKEGGAWAHNFDYMVQVLVDSIEDLGGDVSKYTVPGRT